MELLPPGGWPTPGGGARGQVGADEGRDDHRYLGHGRRGRPGSLAELADAAGAAEADRGAGTGAPRRRVWPPMAQLTFPILPAGLIVDVLVNLEATVLLQLRS